MLKLVPFTEADFPRLLRWIASPELLVQWAGPQLFRYPLTENQLVAYLQTGRGPGARIFKAVDGDGRAVGQIELGGINRENGTASICRVFLDPACRGQGLCAEMVRQVLAVGFGELHLRRIDLRVYGFNESAISCYRRAGLVQEGVLRKAQKMGRQEWDVVIMAILYEEWEGRHRPTSVSGEEAERSVT